MSIIHLSFRFSMHIMQNNCVITDSHTYITSKFEHPCLIFGDHLSGYGPHSNTYPKLTRTATGSTRLINTNAFLERKRADYDRRRNTGNWIFEFREMMKPLFPCKVRESASVISWPQGDPIDTCRYNWTQC